MIPAPRTAVTTLCSSGSRSTVFWDCTPQVTLGLTCAQRGRKAFSCFGMRSAGRRGAWHSTKPQPARQAYYSVLAPLARHWRRNENGRRRLYSTKWVAPYDASASRSSLTSIPKCVKTLARRPMLDWVGAFVPCSERCTFKWPGASRPADVLHRDATTSSGWTNVVTRRPVTGTVRKDVGITATKRLPNCPLLAMKQRHRSIDSARLSPTTTARRHPKIARHGTPRWARLYFRGYVTIMQSGKNTDPTRRGMWEGHSAEPAARSGPRG